MHPQSDKLKIVGAYNYPAQPQSKFRIIAIEVIGDLNLIGDPDDITFIDAETKKATGFAIDDFAFLSPDGKQVWMNLPKTFDTNKIRAVLIVGIPKTLKRIKMQYAETDISDAAPVKGSFPLLPPIAKRIKHNK